MKYLLIASALMLAACDESPRYPTSSVEWSAGAPSSKPIANQFEIPQQSAINYVTRKSGPISIANTVVLRYRVDMAEGVRIFPPSMPDGPSIITLYIQRKGDDWTGRGDMNFYRWYATSKSVIPITAGEHTITVSLSDDKWTAVNVGESFTEYNGIKYRNQKFNDAVANADRVGFVFGGGTGYGHGVRATGPVTFTILSFKIGDQQ